MRLAAYETEGQVGLAASIEGGPFRGLLSTDPKYPGDLDEIIAQGADLADISPKFEKAPAVDLSSVKLLPPLRRPGKILCVGLNYHAHAKEFSDMDVVKYPEIFARFASCLIGHESPVIKPEQSDQLDWEGELAVVIGKGGRGIRKSGALDHVFGYSIFNDVSVRDYQKRVGQWTMGKNFDSTGPFGPWVATPSELPAGGSGLRITTRLNGEIVQDSNTSLLIFDVPTLIEYLSAVMTLGPGDVIVTGTPGGVGVSRVPQLFMKAGDRVEVEIERLGVLSNPVTL
ncbi:MAG: fumarylacetoacetate hydrolase family protein [Deltaproteobacteria bacterium]|jgi:2-keto-4-pentenoate hydratase/2-oxohepta-3-ene-1,7-dioic acid hydratase in catechol pathway|nr:fumarylacetoacetate hydrolase family protein [Deltaproteobacteria bacterium]